MYADARLAIGERLESGESLLWTGVPRQGLVLRASDVFLIPFSICWGGFAVFWELSVLAADGPPFFVVFGVPFVLVGLHLVFGRFVVDSRVRANTFYALTDRRVLIVSGLLSRTTTSVPLRTLRDVSLHERKDGSGTLTFGHPHPFASWYAGVHWPGISPWLPPCFDLIPHARGVYDRLLEAQRAAS